MWYTLLQVVVLAAVVAATVVLARGPIESQWDEAGLRSLYASAVICFVVAVVAAGVLGFTARMRPRYTPHAAFAGTGIRLLGTGATGLMYYWLAKPEVASFLICILGIYVVLLLAETGLIVYIVLRAFPKRAQDTQ